MKRLCILSCLAVVLPACSSSSNPTTNTVTDGSVLDTSTPETDDGGSLPETGSTPHDSGSTTQDSGSTTQDSGSTTQDSGSTTDANPESDASDGGCPGSWFVAPAVDPSIAVPDGGGGVLLHASGSGTQNYVCDATTNDAGTTYTWTLVTPDATLSDCNATPIGHHFASEGGAGFPEWQTNDGTYVIGQKHLPTFIPDGGAASIPWLLLDAVDAGGAGTLRSTLFIQRLNTDGGDAPASTCNAGTVGTTTNIPYTADYYFFGP